MNFKTNNPLIGLGQSQKNMLRIMADNAGSRLLYKTFTERIGYADIAVIDKDGKILSGVYLSLFQSIFSRDLLLQESENKTAFMCSTYYKLQPGLEAHFKTKPVQAPSQHKAPDTGPQLNPLFALGESLEPFIL
jgi:hypothetical protein